MTCQKCVDAVRNSLADLSGIKNVDISLEKGNVVVETSLPYSVIQEKIEVDSGKKAVLKGYGGEKMENAVVLFYDAELYNGLRYR